MDFGLARIVEMFEERFGAKLTTALVAIVALALVAVSLNLIVMDLLIPTYNMAVAVVESAQSRAIVWPPNIARPSRIFSIVMTLVLFGVAYRTVRVSRKLRQESDDFLRESMSVYKEFKALHKDIMESWKEETKEIARVKDEVDKLSTNLPAVPVHLQRCQHRQEKTDGNRTSGQPL